MNLLRAKSFGGYRIYYNIIYIDELMEHMYRIGSPLYKSAPARWPNFLVASLSMCAQPSCGRAI